MTEKERLQLRLQPETREKIQRWQSAAGCRSMNEFVEKAVNFYNNAQAWRALLRAHRNDIAAAMHIPPQDFRWYAAFHDEGHHPHVHMMAWSVKPGQAHLDRNGIRSIRSQLTNDIFQQELLHVYEQKSLSRDDLVKETRKVMLELSRQMRETVCEHSQAEQMIGSCGLTAYHTEVSRLWKGV